jgi:hypothetical protein
MTSKKLSNSVLDKIKKEEIAPRPAWHFLAKNGFFWLIFGIAAILGARAVGVLIFMYFELDVQFLFLIKAFPAFWVIFILLFIIFAMTGLHQTKHGYRLSIQRLLGINLMISLALGSLSYGVGDAAAFELKMAERAPILRSVEEHKQRVWNGPENGRLAGEISSVDDEAQLMLVDFKGNEWEVSYDDAELVRDVELEEGLSIRLDGESLDDFEFEASRIGPWDLEHDFRKRLQHRRGGPGHPPPRR